FQYYKKLSNKLMDIYLNTSYQNFMKDKIFKKINTLRGEVENFVSTLIDAIVIIVLEAVTILFIVTFLFYLYPKETSIIFCLLLFFGSIVAYFYQKKMKIYASLRLNEFNIFQKKILEGLNGFRDIKINNKEEFFLKNFDLSVSKVSNSLYKISNLMQTPRYVVEIFSINILLIVMFFNVNDLNDTNNNIVFLGIFAGAALRLLPSINKLITYLNNLKYAIPILDQLIIDVKKNKPEIKTDSNENIFKSQNHLKLVDINFDYDDTKNINDFIIKNISLEIKKGELIGLFGDTGSGKSTLIDIISGLLNPNNGKILLNDINISNHVHEWRNRIGYVSQFTYLLNDTIEKNIAFGVDQKNIDKDKLLTSLKNSLIYDFVNSLKLKEKTIIGENGVSLSGGQKQRIGIARALYNNPEFLIFDESTNSLDEKTENEFMKNLLELKKEKSIIFVTHKLELLKNCDKILYLKNQKLIELDKKNINQLN
ncbi:ATP-binding cassette domain-containing protein, partial [Candidatus Pelagibacter sp.]|uniref:ATP-binding cassette domain-containing protein n=1 Tax=Candidatus Pelagibacter sp. TaxID=2024849 RepID=UPI003F87D9F1